MDGGDETAGRIGRELRAGVLRLTLDRPARHNALNSTLLRGLAEALAAARGDVAVRSVLIRSDGANFSAGVDLDHMAKLTSLSRDESAADGRLIGEVLRAVATLPQPVIAAVQGPAFGGAMALVAACDLVVAAPEAQFSAAETRLGLVPVLLTPYLAHRVGPAAAKRLLLTCERIDAAEAHRLGLADVLAGDGGLEAEVERVTRMIAASAPGALARTKALVAEAIGGAGLPLDDAALDAAGEAIADARAGAEAAEGIAAFLGKRKPSWRT